MPKQSDRQRTAGRETREPVASVFSSLRRLVDALYSGSRDSQRSRGVTTAQLFVLFQVALSPSLSINELAALTMTHQSTVSVVVRRLARRKLLRKRRSPTDGRRVELTLTESGRRVLSGAPEPIQVRLRRALESLARSDQLSLADALTRVLNDAGLSEAPAAMFLEAAQHPSRVVEPRDGSQR